MVALLFVPDPEPFLGLHRFLERATPPWGTAATDWPCAVTSVRRIE